MKRTSKVTGRTLEARAQFFSGEESETVEFALPEDLDSLSLEDLQALQAKAIEAFDSLYGDGSALSTASMTALSGLTEALESLSTRIESINAAHEAALAARGRVTLAAEPEDEPEDEAEDKDDEDEAEDGEGAAFAQQTQVKFSAKSGRAARSAAEAAAKLSSRRDMREVAFVVGDNLGVAKNSGQDFLGLGTALDQRLKAFNLTQYQGAVKAGRDLREVQAFAQIQLPIDDSLVIKSSDRGHVDEILSRAVASPDKHQALLASGGWAAASEVLYNEFLELESNDGMLTTPEVGVARGGVQITPGTSFADIYSAVGFSYTEDEDIDGEYDTDSGGDPAVGLKPTYHIDAPEFTEYRLGISGLILEAGLLGYRGYPEHFANVIRQALVAHNHKVNAEFIADLVTGSTAITMPATQAGAAAPLLNAIELQATHLRATHRMAFNAVLECKIPVWIKGVLRADLSRRLGVDLVSVTDARLAQFFADRFVAVEYVYDWQPIETTAAGSFTAWPTTVKFLLYPAGTWVKGRSEVLTIDTLYDSTLLQNNDFTALFTEEGWFAAKYGVDSRVVTTSIVPDGATHIGVDIAANGTV